MTDLIENYYSKSEDSNYDTDSQVISRKAISTVLPLIMKNDLTERQQSCLKLKYVKNLNQSQIADMLKLSQPTVCRHISIAKEIVNNRLSYCIVALNKANRLWIDAENSDSF